MTGGSNFESRLRAAAKHLQLACSEAQILTLIKYLEQLQRWNRTYNLTALRDPEQMLVQHLFDSMSVLPKLAPILSSVEGSPVIVDVGSGGGLPGVVLAALCPQATVHCVDTVEKKATFIRYVAGVLHLQNLNAHHARIEALEPLGADIVISRAFASLTDFATLAGKHLKPGGQMVAMKAKAPSEEAAELAERTAWRVARVDDLKVPELEAQRCLVWLNEQGKP